MGEDGEDPPVAVRLVVQAELGEDAAYVRLDRAFGHVQLGGVALLSPYDVFVFGSVLAVVVGLRLLFSYTRVGLRLRASAFAPEVSRLLGVNVAVMRPVSMPGKRLAKNRGAWPVR